MNDPKELNEHSDVVAAGEAAMQSISADNVIQRTGTNEIVTLTNVMHMVTTLRTKAAMNLSSCELLQRTSPAGTVTGLPRDEAIKAISALETFARGPYGGTVACIDHRGGIESAAVIRSILLTNGQACTQAAAGITPSSEIDYELNEIVHKSRACVQAIVAAGTDSVGDVETHT